MTLTILSTATQPVAANSSTGYVIGAIIALFILGYLIYSLFKPEKF